MSRSNCKYAVSHILIAGSTLWCIYNTNRGSGGWKWMYGTYGSLCFYSFVGIWRYGNPRYGNEAATVYETSSKCVQCFTLSCAVTQLYLQYGTQLEYAIIHTIVPCIPFAMYLTRNDWEDDLVDYTVIMNIVSCLFISVSKENYNGIALAVNFGLCHFVLRRREFFEVEPKIFYNIGLCFCAFFAYKAVWEAWLWGDVINKFQEFAEDVMCSVHKLIAKLRKNN